MIHLLVLLAKYLMIFLILFYTFLSFAVFRGKEEQGQARTIYKLQRLLIYLMQWNGYMILYLVTDDFKILLFYFMQLLLMVAVTFLYIKFYRDASMLLLNNMFLLLSLGLIMLCRLSFPKAMRQFFFLAVGILLIFIIPQLLKRFGQLRNLTWLYAIVGIGALLLVLVIGKTSYGAKLSFTIGGISIQPSEFVKILFVFFIAGMLYNNYCFKQIIFTSMIAAIFVLILVASKDLGGALLFFVTYLVLIYVASGHLSYFISGFVAMFLAAILGNHMFSHVRTRVIAWQDPLSVIDKEGYQVSQSLFAIGTGGWFGMGLGQGNPKKIPVVENDFIFSAISEEMGGIVALCMIMICISCFFCIMNLGMQMRDHFYKLVAVGLGTIYIMQCFLMIGGVTKFIPSTGVTLPLVSYGGSSLLSVLVTFGIIQGLYIRQRMESMEEKRMLYEGK